PEKKTFKNNAVTQIRVPEFQSSPSRRLRREGNIGNDSAQSIISGSMQKEKNDKEQQRQIQLEKKRERSRLSRTNETEEQRQIRLEQQRKRSQVNKIKKKLEKQTHENIATEQENTEMRVTTRPPWPEPISRDLKEPRLQQFLQQMSMSELAE